MAEKDYKKSNKKTGVFPMEWLIFENLEHINSLKFDDNLNKDEVNF